MTIRRSVAGRLLFWLLPLLAAAIVLPLLLLEWLDDAGHMTPLEQPARVADLLKTLL